MIVHVKSESVIATDDKATVPWEDVWVRWRINKQTWHFGPTLIGRADMEANQRLSVSIRRSREYRALALKERWYEDEMAEIRAARKAFRRGALVWCCPIDEKGIPNIYWHHDAIDRRAAELMLRALIVRATGIDDLPPLVFKWQKPTVIIHPVSVP